MYFGGQSLHILSSIKHSSPVHCLEQRNLYCKVFCLRVYLEYSIKLSLLSWNFPLSIRQRQGTGATARPRLRSSQLELCIDSTLRSPLQTAFCVVLRRLLHYSIGAESAIHTLRTCATTAHILEGAL